MAVASGPSRTTACKCGSHSSSHSIQASTMSSGSLRGGTVGGGGPKARVSGVPSAPRSGGAVQPANTMPVTLRATDNTAVLSWICGLVRDAWAIRSPLLRRRVECDVRAGVGHGAVGTTSRRPRSWTEDVERRPGVQIHAESLTDGEIASASNADRPHDVVAAGGVVAHVERVADLVLESLVVGRGEHDDHSAIIALKPIQAGD